MELLVRLSEFTSKRRRSLSSMEMWRKSPIVDNRLAVPAHHLVIPSPSDTQDRYVIEDLVSLEEFISPMQSAS